MFKNIEKVVFQAQDVLHFGSWNLLTQKFIISLFTLSKTTFFLKACDDSSHFSYFAQFHFSALLRTDWYSAEPSCIITKSFNTLQIVNQE